MEDTGKIIMGDDFLKAVMAGGGDMVLPPDSPCVDCYGLSCFGCPFDDSE